MAYVDLNPIRAGLAASLADSEKTLVQQRLETVTRPSSGAPTIRLMPFVGTVSDVSRGPPFKLQDYLDLVDTTGRCIREDKGGVIDSETPQLLQQLEVVYDEWLSRVTQLQVRFESVMGSPGRMKAQAEVRGGYFYRGYCDAQRFYLRWVA